MLGCGNPCRPSAFFNPCNTERVHFFHWINALSAHACSFWHLPCNWWRHYYRWRASKELQDLRSALTAISSDSKPSCIKFLWCPVSSKPVIESLSEEHNDLGLTQSGFESPPPAHEANALYHCATTTVWQFFYIIFYYFSMSKRLTEKHALEVEKKIVCCFSISYL